MELNTKNAYLVLSQYLGESCPEKFEHSIKVARISKVLAKKWGEPTSDVIIAAMLHDIGKSMSKKQMLSLCMRNNITVYDFELLENITALHGKISALLFEEEFEGNDSQRIGKISHAISAHVAGAESMNLLDKIIFIADNLESKEEGRELFEQIQAGQIDGPDECIRRVIQQKIERNKKRGYEHNPLLDVTLECIGEER